jgi:hypothetical protein
METYTIGYFEKLSWLAAACSKDPIRYHMCGIHIEREGRTLWLVATDGIRMHILEETADTAIGLFFADIVDGTYEVILPPKKKNGELVALKEIDGTFPNWRGVIPKVTYPLGPVYSGTSKDYGLKDHKLLFDVYSMGLNINTQILLDMEKYDTVSGTWEVAAGLDSGAVIFRRDNAQALIMPKSTSGAALFEAAIIHELKEKGLISTAKRKAANGRLSADQRREKIAEIIEPLHNYLSPSLSGVEKCDKMNTLTEAILQAANLRIPPRLYKEITTPQEVKDFCEKMEKLGDDDAIRAEIEKMKAPPEKPDVSIFIEPPETDPFCDIAHFNKQITDPQQIADICEALNMTVDVDAIRAELAKQTDETEAAQQVAIPPKVSIIDLVTMALIAK